LSSARPSPPRTSRGRRVGNFPPETQRIPYAVTFDELPLFPLHLVLFPGTALPLHIFEPRYRQLLADCLEGDRRFGLIRLPDGTAERDIPAGTVGCVAEILNTEPLADVRSNILVRGAERFALASFVGSAHPYHVCRAELVEDEFEIGHELDTLAERVRDVFRRVAHAARTLSDDPDPIPDLPDEAPSLSFAIASMIDIGLDARQELLSSRSPQARLRQLDDILSAALGTIVQRAQVHTLAKTNGHGGAPAKP